MRCSSSTHLVTCCGRSWRRIRRLRRFDSQASAAAAAAVNFVEQNASAVESNKGQSNQEMKGTNQVDGDCMQTYNLLHCSSLIESRASEVDKSITRTRTESTSLLSWRKLPGKFQEIPVNPAPKTVLDFSKRTIHKVTQLRSDAEM
jgi:hypothetical protein